MDSMEEVDYTPEVLAYFRNSFGPVDRDAQIEIIPTGLPIAVNFIPSAPDRPFVTMFTTGMSAHPMEVPEGYEEYARAELFMQLPADWRYREFHKPEWSWPSKWLRTIAQYPSQFDTWLGGGAAVVPNGNPPQPLGPNVAFSGWLFLAERELKTIDRQTIWLYRIQPIYAEELEVAQDQGIPVLLNAFDLANVPFVVDLNRPNIAV